MFSEKKQSKRKQEEEKLYEPIKNELENTFKQYVRKGKKEFLQSGPLSSPEKRDVYIEITASKRISDILKRQFDTYALYYLKVEGSYPDIMGFVRKNSPKDLKELITVEVKSIPINVKHIERARTYQDVFNATYGLLVSSRGIPEEVRRFVFNRPKIRGNLIIAHFIPYPHGGLFQIHPDFKSDTPEPFKRFAKPL